MIALGHRQLHHLTGSSNRTDTHHTIVTSSVTQVQDFTGQQAGYLAVLIRVVIGQLPGHVQDLHSVGRQRNELPYLPIPSRHDPGIGVAAQQDTRLHPFPKFESGLLLVGLLVQDTVKRMIRCPFTVVTIAAVQDQRQGCRSLGDGLHAGIDSRDALCRYRVHRARAQRGKVRPIRITAHCLIGGTALEQFG